MKLIIKNHGGGKTIEAIKLAIKENLYIVAANEKECYRIFSIVQSMGLNINFPITYSELINAFYHKPGIKGFIIDEAERFIEYVVKSDKIKYITLTKENEVHDV
jgi:hypothetical protein